MGRPCGRRSIRWGAARQRGLLEGRPHTDRDGLGMQMALRLKQTEKERGETGGNPGCGEGTWPLTGLAEERQGPGAGAGGGARGGASRLAPPPALCFRCRVSFPSPALSPGPRVPQGFGEQMLCPRKHITRERKAGSLKN